MDAKERVTKKRENDINAAWRAFGYGAQKTLRSNNLSDKEKVDFLLLKLTVAEREVDHADSEYLSEMYDIICDELR